jgi:hypothetical protein
MGNNKKESQMPLTKKQAKDAIDALNGYGRSIISAERGEELAQGFGVSLADLGIKVKVRKPGVNWDERSEVWGEGESVDAYALTMRLADHFDCPDNDYPTNYMGTGKWVEAQHVKAQWRLREKFLGETLPKCECCGSVDNARDWSHDHEVGAGRRLCWPCFRDLRNLALDREGVK